MAYIVCKSGGGIKQSTLTNQIPIMTSNTTPSGVASASGEWDGGNQAWRAFADAGNQWTASSGQKVGAWLQYKFASAQKIQLLSVKNTQYTVAKSFKIQGSNDGSTYIDIASLTVPDVNGFAESLFIFPNNSSYLYYRLYVTESGPINQLNAVGFMRIKMY
jgi:hypothetical protein